MSSRTLDDALADLDRIFAVTRASRSRLGLFPAMYRQVTRSIHRAVREGGLFDDDERLERVATIFADRYISAFDGHHAGGAVARCWHTTFEVAEGRRRRMILQHLLMGMNAHINFDLGIAAADVTGEEIRLLHDDFVRVNEILFVMVDRLQGSLGDVSPRMALLDRLGRDWDEALMRFGIREARAMAWPFALRVAASDEPARRVVIEDRDSDAELVGRLITGGWSPVHVVGRLIASAEFDDVPAIMDTLAALEVDPFVAADAPLVTLEADDIRLGSRVSRRMRRG